MLEKKEYRAFSKKLSKILNTCKLSKEEVSTLPRIAYYEDKGFWEATKDTSYFFDKKKVATQKDAILDLCRDLPKLEGEVPGFARNDFSN